MYLIARTTGIKTKLWSVVEDGIEIIRSLSRKKCSLIVEKLNNVSSSQSDEIGNRHPEIQIQPEHESNDTLDVDGIGQSREDGCNGTSSVVLSESGGQPISLKQSKEYDSLIASSRKENQTSGEFLEKIVDGVIDRTRANFRNVVNEHQNVVNEHQNVVNEHQNVVNICNTVIGVARVSLAINHKLVEEMSSSDDRRTESIGSQRNTIEQQTINIESIEI